CARIYSGSYYLMYFDYW
nr:immunoglobulin heavy chain junction region [Macaca mulatta]MOV39100.1 immunoglobulin heavy chain junction region [Macaca mulatta]MOV39164.1 immunoglobulin heavy chain junction region [Macaca mulatta]MOV41445.1 immunoglobulin heavy chain junction region [Macaca mulatta]MOV41541.1 immunoglobulin heavy chain junction region [Macaca mulatta]